FVVWSGDCDFRRHRAGLQGNRKAHVVHGSVAAGTALGVHHWEILWTGRYAGGQCILHGDGRVRGAPLRSAQISEAGWVGAGRAVFHHPTVFDHLLAGAAVFVIFLASVVGGVRVLVIRDLIIRGGFA